MPTIREVKCDQCGGWGKITRTCNDCGGKGCGRCGRTGTIPVTCPQCGGSGLKRN